MLSLGPLRAMESPGAQTPVEGSAVERAFEAARAPGYSPRLKPYFEGRTAPWLTERSTRVSRSLQSEGA